MSFLNKLKQSLGLVDEEYKDYEDEESNDGVSSITGNKKNIIREKTAFTEKFNSFSEETDAPTYSLEDLKYKIFDGVLEIFNSSLPSFLQDSIDGEKQKQNLFNSLDSGLKRYFAEIEHEASVKGEAIYRSELAMAKNEMESLKARSRKVEEQRKEMQESRLSADRQKRALNERIQDLEKSLASAEADREQLDLENKGLLNKLRLASMGGGIAGEDSASGIGLEEIEALKEENTKLKEAVEAYAEKDRTAGQLYNDAVNSVSSLRRDLEEKEATIKKLEAYMTQMEEMNQKMEEIDGLIERRDSIIAKLKEKNKLLSGKLEASESEVERLGARVDELQSATLERDKIAEEKARKAEEERERREEEQRRRMSENEVMRITDSQIEEVAKKFRTGKSDVTPSDLPEKNASSYEEKDLDTGDRVAEGYAGKENHFMTEKSESKTKKPKHKDKGKRGQGGNQQSLPFQLSLF